MDGIDAEVLYGITGTGMRLKEHDTIAETYRTYNDWVSDFCDSNPGRWYALACIPIHDPNLAAAELQRAADKGPIRGADLIASEVTWPIYTRDGFWDPLWDVVAKNRMSISFHVGGGRIPVPPPPNGDASSNGDSSQNALAHQGVTQSLGQLSGVQWLIGIILSGTCEKFPDFKFVMGECGAGWVPFVLGRMDHIYLDSALDKKFDPPLSLLPSEYWFRQGRHHLPGRVRRCPDGPPHRRGQHDVGFRLPPPRRRLARLQGNHPGNDGRPRPRRPHENHPRQRRQPIPHGPITPTHKPKKVGGAPRGRPFLMSSYNRSVVRPDFSHRTTLVDIRHAFLDNRGGGFETRQIPQHITYSRTTLRHSCESRNPRRRGRAVPSYPFPLTRESLRWG